MKIIVTLLLLQPTVRYFEFTDSSMAGTDSIRVWILEENTYRPLAYPAWNKNHAHEATRCNTVIIGKLKITAVNDTIQINGVTK